jgi:alkylation response protein AidB-like acyl-CoA dehydrogenase
MALLLLGAHDRDGAQRWFAIDADAAGVRIADRAGVDLARPAARISLCDAAVPAGRELPGLTEDRVRDLAAALAAAEAAGLARWCLCTAAEHARVREQFGRPIGSFQAVKHLCVAMLCRVEQAEALAWDAARAAEENPAELPLAAAAAAAFALDAAVDTAKDAIQVLGGIGFTWEHDAHLYLRRALANRALLGPTPAWRARLATLALAEPGARSACRCRRRWRRSAQRCAPPSRRWRRCPSPRAGLRWPTPACSPRTGRRPTVRTPRRPASCSSTPSCAGPGCPDPTW